MKYFKSIQELDLSQRIYLMEELWDSFKYESDSLTSPLWHRDILQKRKEAYSKGKIKTKTLEEVKEFFSKWKGIK